MDNINIGEIIIWFVVFLLSLSVHECFHALAAELSGDPTGRYMGRITLNPIPHIDPFGTILLPMMMLLMPLFTGGSSFGMFGWAKPVPFNPMNLRDRRKGEIFIAIAGPLGNVLLVIVFMGLFWLMKHNLWLVTILSENGLVEPISTFIRIGIQLNIILAVFNMIPIPPLDGSHVLRNILPDSLASAYDSVPPIAGFIVLLVLINLGFTSMLFAPVFNFVIRVLNTF